MNTEDIFCQIENAIENKYYDKKTLKLIKQTYKKLFEKSAKKKSNKIILPFYGYIFEDKCFGIKKNYNLYTQCTRSKHNDYYCKSCLKQCKKTIDKKPLYGDIRDRKEQWNENLTWKPKNCTKEVPFIDVVEKLQLDLTKIKNKVKILKWREIPACHFKKKTKKKKRKKQYHLCSSDEE